METLQPPDRTSARVIEAYCALLDSPADRLRFIRRAVARCQREAAGADSRWPMFERFRLRKIVIDELVPLLPSGASLPLAVRVGLWAYRLRVPIYAAAVVGVIAAVSLLGFAAARVALTPAEAIGAAPDGPTGTSGPGEGTALVAALPQYAPEQIWLVERGEGYEVYSNGARVLTEFEVAGEPRRFFEFARGGDPAAAVERGGAPVGIVYHTSQSHIAPFSAEYNEKLRTSSRALLEYVRAKRLYHYVIDRFGRIYRVVDEGAAADHAGNSVWSSGEVAYLDLSDSFLGVCFEAEWSPDVRLAPDQINEAQVYAGRVLTAMLRSKHGVPDANCVTHAIVSVSPASRLVGFHMDWGRAFPFAAIGLSDKYAVETPSVAEFGFGHDAAFDRAVGELWPGIVRAEARLEEEARRESVAVAELRRRLQERYRAHRVWLARHRAWDAGAGG